MITIISLRHMFGRAYSQTCIMLQNAPPKCVGEPLTAQLRKAFWGVVSERIWNESVNQAVNQPVEKLAYLLLHRRKLLKSFGAGGGTRTPTARRPADFKSAASTGSATPAQVPVTGKRMLPSAPKGKQDQDVIAIEDRAVVNDCRDDAGRVQGNYPLFADILRRRDQVMACRAMAAALETLRERIGPGRSSRRRWSHFCRVS